MIPVKDGTCPHRAGIGAGTGLCEAPGAEFLAARQRRQEALLLFFGADREDVPRAQRIVRSDEEGNSGVNPRNLFNDERGAQRVVPCTAILLRHHDAEQPLFGELRDQL